LFAAVSADLDPHFTGVAIGGKNRAIFADEHGRMRYAVQQGGAQPFCFPLKFLRTLALIDVDEVGQNGRLSLKVQPGGDQVHPFGFGFGSDDAQLVVVGRRHSFEALGGSLSRHIAIGGVNDIKGIYLQDLVFAQPDHLLQRGIGIDNAIFLKYKQT